MTEKPTTTQSILCSKSRFSSKEEAAKWVTDHDYKAEKVDETEENYRFRQREPGDFEEGSFRTITLEEGVKAIIGHLRDGRKNMATGETTLCRMLHASPEKSQGRRTKFVFSTSRYQDSRHGDGYALPPEAADLSRFKRFVWNHRVSDLELGFGAFVEPEDVLGRIAGAHVDGERLVGEVDWADEEINPKAERVRKMYEADLMDEVSIRFRVLEANAPTEEQRRRFGIPSEDEDARVASKWAAYEASAVVIGMDPDAVKLARSRGILSAEEADDLLLPPVPWKSIEQRLEKLSSRSEECLEKLSSRNEERLEKLVRKLLDETFQRGVGMMVEHAHSLEARLQDIQVSASGARAAQDSARQKPGSRYHQLEDLLREVKAARAKTLT